MSAPKLALLLESDGPGGAEYMLLHLAVELRRRGWEVLPVGPEERSGWLGDRLREQGFELATFRLRGPLDGRCLRGLVRLFKEQGVDVAHSHEFSLAVYGAAAARLAGVPHVITMHGGRYYGERRRRRVALRWAMSLSAATVAVSKATQKEMASNLGVAPARIRVIPNGIPPRKGTQAGAAANRTGSVRRELGLADDEPLVLAVGNLYPVKGHAVLLDALARLEQREPELPWSLAIAGRGGEEDRLRSRAQRGGIGKRVHLLGFRDDVGALLEAADVYVMPSLSEGLPLALLEAMHAEKAIVASGVGGIPEAVSTGREAILVPPGDADGLSRALAAVLGRPELRRALGSAAAERARSRFSVGAMADSYEALYGTRAGNEMEWDPKELGQGHAVEREEPVESAEEPVESAEEPAADSEGRIGAPVERSR